MAANIAELVNNMRRVMWTLGANPDPCRVAVWFHAQLGSGIQIGIEPIEYPVYELPPAPHKVTLPQQPAMENSSDIIMRFQCLRNTPGGLICLFADRARPNHNRTLYREAKGIVLEYPSWCVLAVPPPNLSTAISHKTLQRHFADYKVCDVHDGTIVTIYRHGDRIRMSTRRSSDISDVKWLGQITYREAFDEVARAYPNFHLDALSYSHSYSIGFRHADFHPLMADPAHMWLIQRTNLSTMESEYDPDIGLPLQEYVKIGLDEIRAKCQSALGDFISTGVINYGYILRGNCGERSNILTESSLYVAVRKMMYDFPDLKAGHMRMTSAEQRIVYVTLRAFLTPGWHVKFVKLYPQYQSYFESYDKLMDEMRRKIYNDIRRPPMRKPDANIGELENVISALVVAMRKENINVSSKDAGSIIRDYVRNPQHMHTYLPICCARILHEQQLANQSTTKTIVAAD